MKRRTFSAEFKTKVVLELLKGEKELNTIASENSIAPNQLRNWKSEFLKNASAAFDDKRTEALKTELLTVRKQEDVLYRKIGRLTTQVDWLKKKSEETFGSEWESLYTPKPEDGE